MYQIRTPPAVGGRRQRRENPLTRYAGAPLEARGALDLCKSPRSNRRGRRPRRPARTIRANAGLHRRGGNLPPARVILRSEATKDLLTDEAARKNDLIADLLFASSIFSLLVQRESGQKEKAHRGRGFRFPLPRTPTLETTKERDTPSFESPLRRTGGKGVLLSAAFASAIGGRRLIRHPACVRRRMPPSP